MCLGTAAAAEDEVLGFRAGGAVDSTAETVDWIYGNTRGMKQGCGDLCTAVASKRPSFFAANETHLDGDPVKSMIPPGYKIICRLDRNSHGGGLIIGGKKHILADTLPLQKYNTRGVVEMQGIEWDGKHWILYYTPNSHAAQQLIQVIQQYKEDHSGVDCIFIGDMNVHNSDWIVSTSPTDKAGLMAQEFAESFGMQQLVDFPTRAGNTLDIVLSDLDGSAVETPGFGNSDHTSMYLSFKCHSIPVTPIKHSVYDWQSVHWNHIRGAVKRAVKDWKPTGTVEDAEGDLDGILEAIIVDRVKMKAPAKPGPTPWWNNKCKKAYKWKLKCFMNRAADPVKYKAALSFNRKIQRKAYGAYQRKIKLKLNSMSTADSGFWQLAKEIGGLEASRAQAAPSPQDLADHFAEKMSNGRDIEDNDFIPKSDFKIRLTSFKVRFKVVKKILKTLDVKKSANGIPPVFWRECADQVAPCLTKLFKYIARKAKYVTRWKEGRVSAPHKRGSVKLPKNYRPLKVLMNISVIFERAIHDELYHWISQFIPKSQFGFLRGVGTKEYGCSLAFKVLEILERRGECIIIPLDVKGAFDRVWWDRLKKRFEAKGMTDRALELMKDYLFNRFLRVVCQGSSSSKKQIFSGVPQGAVWSPDFWDFDISELPDAICSEGDEICYADDCGLLYEITEDNRTLIAAIINLDLDSLIEWGDDNLTTFEPEKASYTVVSRKKRPYDPNDYCSGIKMGGAAVEQLDEAKLVGYLFDSQFGFGKMVDKIARKARTRIAALRRLKPMLDSDNLQMMYTMFIRSILEYGSLVYMGAAQSHLDKLDRVQQSAEKIGGFKVESLQSRREAAAVSLAFDLLDGSTHSSLLQYKHTLIEPLKLTKKRTRYSTAAGVQLKSNSKTNSLDSFKRS